MNHEHGHFQEKHGQYN